jgi:hypothetical protein
VADASRASLIELNSGDDHSSMDFSPIRNQTYKIRGRIVDSAESSSDGGYLLKIDTADGATSIDNLGVVDPKDKTFEVAGVLPGDYVLVAYGYNDHRTPSYGFARVEITDADVDSVVLVIKSTVEIRGRIAIEGAATLPKELVVELNPRESDVSVFRNQQEPVKTDGTFEFKDVYDGLYQVSILSQCTECYLKVGTLNGSDVLERGLQVSGELSQGLDLLLSTHTAMVDGVVARDDGSPAVRATILLVPDPPFRERSGRYKYEVTDQHGRFSVVGVAPGGYRVFALRKPPEFASEFEDPEFTKPFESQGEPISLSENGRKTLQLKLIDNAPESPAK